MANNVRTAEDLERKYNFASLLGLRKNVQMNEKSITKVNNELANMLNTLIINLKDVLDSQSEVSLWFYSGIPTIENEPYIKWASPEDHHGDIYYDQATGYVYQYKENGWTRNIDTTLIQAMALTNVELDTTTDHERKVYFKQPEPPYASGDWWILEDGTLKICQLGKETGEYDTEDFIVSSKYVATVASKTDETITVLKGTVMKISDTYVSIEDLATGGKTIINGANITTGTINTDNVTIGNENVVIDEEGMKLKNGAKVVGENGLMNTYLFTNGSSFEMCGYSSNDPSGMSASTAKKRGVKVVFNIPDGLNVTSAKLIIYHAPIYWEWLNDATYLAENGWGYCRGLKLYKAENMNNRKYFAAVSSEYYETDTTEYTEISEALGATGWNPAVPNNTTHETEEITTIDIKEDISTGLNELLIQPGETISGVVSPSYICERTAFVYAMLKIDGYMSY